MMACASTPLSRPGQQYFPITSAYVGAGSAKSRYLKTTATPARRTKKNAKIARIYQFSAW
jgi:hypothetical protein